MPEIAQDCMAKTGGLPRPWIAGYMLSDTIVGLRRSRWAPG